MNKIIKNSKSGSAMIETIMEFIIIMMMLCMFMALWQPIMIYLNVNYYARNITTAIECAGNANKTTVEGILDDLDDTINIGDSFDVEPNTKLYAPSGGVTYTSSGSKGVKVAIEPVDGWYTEGGHSKNKRYIQLGDGFNVTVSCEKDISLTLFGVDVNIPMTYNRKLYGVSQVYTKPK